MRIALVSREIHPYVGGGIAPIVTAAAGLLSEIAEVTQLPLGTVKTYIHRARKELAADLAEAGWGPPGAGRNPHRKAFVGRAGG